MKKITNILFCSLLSALLLVACGSKNRTGDSNNVEILRYEQILFDTPADKLPDALRKFQTEYNSPLLNIYPDNEQFVSQIADFTSDATVRDIYDITQKRYGDIHWLEKELSAALKKAHSLYGEFDFDQFATFVSASFDYSQRILAHPESKSILVSIDQYALGSMEKYSWFGLPMYLVELSDSAYLASDIMAEAARQFIAMPDEETTTMLDLMVAEGKVLYFLDQVMPRKDDKTKIRYSQEQMDWMKKNESNVWAYYIQNELLYECDFNRYHNLVDEAPKTNAFKDSAPRTAHYIGWQIVRKYMENNKSTIEELFNNTNSQSILQESKYKP